MDMIRGVFLSWIVVENLENAVYFYTQKLGLNLKNLDTANGWAELQGKEGGILGLSEQNSQFHLKAGTNAIVTIAVHCVEESRKLLSDKGVKLCGDVIQLPGNIKLQTFWDLDGNMMQLIEILND